MCCIRTGLACALNGESHPDWPVIFSVMDPLEKAVHDHRHAVEAEKAARAALHEQIWRARQSGVSQVEIVRRTGYTREHVRRIERSFEEKI